MTRGWMAGTAALLVGFVVSGCGDDSGLGRRYPISGTVTYKGEPVKNGTIEFMPKDQANGRAASGSIVDGKYYLTTATDGDGALPGEYMVVVKAKADLDMSQAEANAAGGAMRQDDVVKAIKAAKDLVPPKYNLPTTSGLTYTVESSSSSVNFDLTD